MSTNLEILAQCADEAMVVDELHPMRDTIVGIVQQAREKSSVYKKGGKVSRYLFVGKHSCKKYWWLRFPAGLQSVSGLQGFLSFGSEQQAIAVLIDRFSVYDVGGISLLRTNAPIWK